MTAPMSSTSSRRVSCAVPRNHLAQPYDDDLTDIVVPVAELIGYTLLEWQRDQLADWSAVREDGTWVHHRCGDSIPRQAGKSVSGIVWAVVLSALMGYKVLWTDHNYSTTCEMLDRFRNVFGARPNDGARGIKQFNRRLLSANSKTAQEDFKFKNGGVLAFSTRTKSAALGYSFDVVIFDEAQELTDEQVQAIMPTTTSGAKQNPQFLFLGTPTRAGSSATVFQDVREQALEGGDRASDLCWLEYGLSEVGDVHDEERWYEANPSLGYHSNIMAIRSASNNMTELAFAQEYLGYWLPRVANAVVSADEWGECLIEPERARGIDGRTAYGIKFSVDGSSVALSAAVRPEEGPVHVELVAIEPTSKGTGWLADWLQGRAGRASVAVVDGQSGAGSLCDRLAGRVPRKYLQRAGAQDMVTACSTFLEGIETKAVTHIDQQQLTDAMLTSTRRKIGSRGGWGWDGELAYVADSASLAVWAAKTTKRNPARRQVVW